MAVARPAPGLPIPQRSKPRHRTTGRAGAARRVHARPSQIRAGKLKALAVTTPARSPAFPDLATLQELGVPNYDVTTWYGLWAPAGTPPEIVNKLRDEVVKAMQRPEIKEAWAQQGSGIGGNTPQEFAAFINVEVVKWGKVAKAANITID
ncbi:MAG: tripartite tricarboxylate transporter substrate-binding protein [Burkholderiales bacterium]